jgi:hypothetical protein
MAKTRKDRRSAKNGGAIKINQRAAYTVDEFCDDYRISRAKLYELWNAGRGPRCKRDGKWVIITREDAQEWARRDDQPEAQAS